MRYLLDTNVVSELVARRPQPRVVEWVDARDPDEMYLSVITIGELHRGIAKLPDSERRRKLEAWVRDELVPGFRDHILTLDVEAMRAWGTLCGVLDRAGKKLPALDSLIAALAIHHDCALVTRNESDFAVAELQVINPWK